MKPNTLLLVGGIAVGAYFLYRWVSQSAAAAPTAQTYDPTALRTTAFTSASPIADMNALMNSIAVAQGGTPGIV